MGRGQFLCNAANTLLRGYWLPVCITGRNRSQPQSSAFLQCLNFIRLKEQFFFFPFSAVSSTWKLIPVLKNVGTGASGQQGEASTHMSHIIRAPGAATLPPASPEEACQPTPPQGLAALFLLGAGVPNALCSVPTEGSGRGMGECAGRMWVNQTEPGRASPWKITGPHPTRKAGTHSQRPTTTRGHGRDPSPQPEAPSSATPSLP